MMFDKTPQFIRKNNHLTFIHYPSPHLQLQNYLFDDLNYDEELFKLFKFILSLLLKILIDEIDKKSKTIDTNLFDHF